MSYGFAIALAALASSTGVFAKTPATPAKTSTAAEAPKPSATVKDLEVAGDVLFHSFVDVIKDGDFSIRQTRFADKTSGEDAFREKVKFNKDFELERYDVEQLQLNEHGFIQVDREKQKIIFEYFKEGKLKKSEEPLKTPLIVGSMIPSIIEERLHDLEVGKNWKFQLAVHYIRKYFPFELRREADQTLEGKTYKVFKMGPLQYLMKAVIKPLYFFYDPSTKKVQLIHGRVFLKKKTEKGLESFQAETKIN